MFNYSAINSYSWSKHYRWKSIPNHVKGLLITFDFPHTHEPTIAFGRAAGSNAITSAICSVGIHSIRLFIDAHHSCVVVSMIFASSVSFMTHFASGIEQEITKALLTTSSDLKFILGTAWIRIFNARINDRIRNILFRLKRFNKKLIDSRKATWIYGKMSGIFWMETWWGWNKWFKPYRAKNMRSSGTKQFLFTLSFFLPSVSIKFLQFLSKNRFLFSVSRVPLNKKLLLGSKWKWFSVISKIVSKQILR